jgi:hypothetical protein
MGKPSSPTYWLNKSAACGLKYRKWEGPGICAEAQKELPRRQQHLIAWSENEQADLWSAFRLKFHSNINCCRHLN